MLTLLGAGVGKGIAIGRAYVVQRSQLEIPSYTISDDRIDAECRRLSDAIAEARTQLLAIRDTIPSGSPSEVAGFLDAHLLILEDPMLTEESLETIRSHRMNAEAALEHQVERLVAVFTRMENPYLREKQTDIRQVTSRVQRALLNLSDEATPRIEGSLEGQIVVAADLTPADTVLLRHHEMAAFATDLGGPISHTAILARSLRIPAIVGLHGATRYIRNGEQLIVDGKRGVVLVGPDNRILREYRNRQREIARMQGELESLRNTQTVTRDGEKVQLMANIELPEDIEAARRFGAAGVGLYRTEYLFMNRDRPPDEEEQFNAYLTVVQKLRKPVVIRTLDLGADKQVDGGRTGITAITNPALGLRAVRLCLSDPGLFRPQLRAILRVSAYGPVQIMIPMLSSLEELDQVMEIITEVRQELAREGHNFDPDVPVGGMIEVPAAAVAADLFAQRLDFLSIGTNDLIQYTLAIDRVDDAVNYLYDPLHPAVLRLIRNTIDAGRLAGIPVSMCGEMAGDPRYIRLLLGMGLRIFSMDPTALLEAKKVVLESSVRSLRRRARELMVAGNGRRMREMLRRMNRARAA